MFNIYLNIKNGHDCSVFDICYLLHIYLGYPVIYMHICLFSIIVMIRLINRLICKLFPCSYFPAHNLYLNLPRVHLNIRETNIILRILYFQFHNRKYFFLSLFLSKSLHCCNSSTPHYPHTTLKPYFT